MDCKSRSDTKEQTLRGTHKFQLQAPFDGFEAHIRVNFTGMHVSVFPEEPTSETFKFETYIVFQQAGEQEQERMELEERTYLWKAQSYYYGGGVQLNKQLHEIWTKLHGKLLRKVRRGLREGLRYA